MLRLAIFTVAHEENSRFGVIGQLVAAHTMMAVVVRRDGASVASDPLGVITKERVADSIAFSLRSYTSIDGKL
jgi:chloride channel protein, CIC family